jgi:hypothetical protein
LKSSPATIVTTAKMTNGSAAPRLFTADEISASSVEPAIPYSNENPYRMNPEETAPSSRYFSAASFERRSTRVKPTRI